MSLRVSGESRGPREIGWPSRFGADTTFLWRGLGGMVSFWFACESKGCTSSWRLEVGEVLNIYNYNYISISFVYYQIKRIELKRNNSHNFCSSMTNVHSMLPYLSKSQSFYILGNQELKQFIEYQILNHLSPN